MLSLAVVKSCHLQTKYCISHPLVRLIVWLEELYSFLWVYLHWLVKLPVPMEPLSMPPVSQRCPSFVYRVYVSFIQSPFAIILLFKGSWNLIWPFQLLWRSWSIVYLQPLWRSWSFVYLHHGDSDLCVGDIYHHKHSFWSNWPC